jgi:hypothetical protein
VDVALFPQNVGFLILKVRIEQDAPSVALTRDFHHLIRLVHPPRVGWLLAAWKSASAGSGFNFVSRDLVDYLLQGLAGPPDIVEINLIHYISRIAQSGDRFRYSDSPEGETYGQAFNVYTFGLLQQEPNRAGEAAAAAVVEHVESLFDSPARQALYELATCTDSSLPDYVPHPGYLDHLWERSLFAHWDNWQALVLHDNVVFLGVRLTGFTRHALGHNVETDYFNLYLLTLFQKMRLSLMFGEQMMRDSHLHRNLKKARELWNAFLSFQDLYWFSEATRGRQGTDLYRHYQEALDVIALHRQMSAQVRELQDHYEGKYERRLGRLMNLLTFFGLPTSLVISLFSKIFVPEQFPVPYAIASTILLYAAFFLLWGAWTYYRPE